MLETLEARDGGVGLVNILDSVARVMHYGFHDL